MGKKKRSSVTSTGSRDFDDRQQTGFSKRDIQHTTLPSNAGVGSGGVGNSASFRPVGIFSGRPGNTFDATPSSFPPPPTSLDFNTDERSVAQARASVMVYNNDMKKWEHAGGAAGLSRVHIYFHPSNETYRIVGRKVNDNDVVLNCGIGKSLKYNKATATFHQWRDQRQVYGLNFQTPDDAVVFSEAVLAAVDYVSNPPEPVQQYQQRAPEPPRTAQPAPQPPPAAPQPPRGGNIPAPPPPPPVNNIPPSTPAPPPPALPGGGGGPPPPPPPPPGSGGGGPPPPPPPPPSGGGGGGGLADALKGVQLKKKSEIVERAPPPGNPMDDMMSALNRKLMARKKMSETNDGDADTNQSSGSASPKAMPAAPPAPAFKQQTPPAPFSKPTNVVIPSNKKTETLSRSNTISSETSALESSSDDSNNMKEEILKVVRDEIKAAKEEIIEAMRQELRSMAR